MTNKERTKAIKDELKKLGYGSKQVSVRSRYCGYSDATDEEMFVPKELVRDLLKESYALSEHRKDQLTEAKEIIKELLLSDTRKGSDWTGYLIDLKERAEQFLKDSEVKK